MPIDWDKIAEKLADDTALELGLDGEEPVKLTGAELKSFVKQNRDTLSQRQAEIAARDQELGALRKYQQDTSALFGQAARIASQPDPDPRQPSRPTGVAANLTPADPFDEEYGNDPLFAPFAKKYGQKVLRDVQETLLKPFIETQLAPELRARDQKFDVVTRLLLEERQKREFADLREWPEGTDFDGARKLAIEKRYIVPGGEQYGLVDFRRLNDDLMTPIRHQKELAQARQEGAEEAAARLRAGTNIIQMPNRTGGGGPKGPSRRVAGSADAVIDNALGEAAQDRETLKLLQALPK